MNVVSDPAANHRRAIEIAIRAIPRGCVASYGDIAARAGLPGRARWVGRVLREAGEKAGLPWHRVVRANGRIAFGSSSEAFVEQCDRLAREGVTVARGRVERSRFGLDVDIDAQLWAPRNVGKHVTRR
ncbi:MAG: MGMT family protein [Dokdonella sp.]